MELASNRYDPKNPEHRTQPKDITEKLIRVSYKRYLNEVNQTLQSLMTVGKLKKNQLMSINNRAMFNRGKVQRCEWLQRSKQGIKSNFLPNLESINLDARSPNKKEQKKHRRYHTEVQRKDKETISKSENRYIENLIDEQMRMIKKKKLIEKGKDRTQIVREACSVIEKNLINSIKTPVADKILVRDLGSRKKNTKHQRSVTDAIYHMELNQISRKEKAKEKYRNLEQRDFFRRIKNNAHQ